MAPINTDILLSLNKICRCCQFWRSSPRRIDAQKERQSGTAVSVITGRIRVLQPLNNEMRVAIKMYSNQLKFEEISKQN